MTISCLMVHWFERLASQGIIAPRARLLEFGPQDVSTPREVVEAVANRLHAPHEAERRIAAIFDGPGARRDCQGNFYGLFGVSSYRSLDPFDDRADYRYDLGRFVPVFGRYDVVTNFGTAEHVFDIANVFGTAHRLLKEGGLLLNVLPAYGDIDHGFFNIHPVLYKTMALHSGYEICDFHYIDDIAWRTERQSAAPQDMFDFDDLPIRPQEISDSAALKRLVHDTMMANAAKRNLSAATPPPVFDYCFVALRKTRAGRFVAPYQYSERPPSRWSNLWAFVSGARWRGHLRKKARYAASQMIPSRYRPTLRALLARMSGS